MEILKELYGSWADVDEHLAIDIIEGRTISTREVNFDYQKIIAELQK
ncbi:MAG: hypothetical protein ACPG19_02875 [Saprospiraceae bacterium]